MAITISALQTEYGAFYKAGGQNEQNMFNKLYRTAEFDSLFTYRPTKDTIVRNVTVHANSVLQAYQKAFTPKGGGEFKPAPINLYKVKADDALTPDEIEASYVGFLAGEGQDKSQWPIVRWWIENVLFNQFAEDIDTNAFSAVYAAPTTGTAGDSDEALDGLHKVLKDLIADSYLPSGNIITTGALDTDPSDFVTQLEEFIMGIPEYLRRRLKMELMLNTTLEQRFRAGMRAKYNMNYAQANLGAFIDFPNISVVGVSAMGTSSKLIVSQKSNRVLYMKRPDLMVDIQKDGRQINLLHDHWRGYGFADARAVWTNDLENS